MTSHAKTIWVTLAATFLLGLNASQGQDLGQQVDPSTPYGQSVIQNEQDHQQAVQDQHEINRTGRIISNASKGRWMT
jgi:hypothetical protein